MKDSGSPNLISLIDCTKAIKDSDFYIIKKGRRSEAKEQTQLRDDKDAKTDDEEVCLIKNTKESKKSDIEYRVKDKFAYVKLYIKKDDDRTDIKAFRSRYENVVMQEQYVSETKRTIETILYRKEREMTFETFVRNLVKTVGELEK